MFHVKLDRHHYKNTIFVKFHHFRILFWGKLSSQKAEVQVRSQVSGEKVFSDEVE